MNNRINLSKILRAFEFPVIFVSMLCSCGVLGAFLLRFSLSFDNLVILVPLAFASVVSCYRFYRIIKKMESMEGEGILPSRNDVTM
jgi:hypothetical protein